MSLQARYTVTALGWQYAVRRQGTLVSVHDEKADALAEAARLRESSS